MQAPRRPSILAARAGKALPALWLPALIGKEGEAGTCTAADLHKRDPKRHVTQPSSQENPRLKDEADPASAGFQRGVSILLETLCTTAAFAEAGSSSPLHVRPLR